MNADGATDNGQAAAAGPIGGMGDLELEYRPAASLIPYANNARTHSDAQVARIAASIREFGWTNPILVDGEYGIIAGHGRLLAARQLGLASVPVIELKGLSEAQKRAYVIADNRLALDAGWDPELLALEFGALEDLGFDLALTGFGAAAAGLMYASRVASANPTQGSGLMLNAIAAVFLGMTMSEEGEPRVHATLIGVLILGVLDNGLTQMSVDSYVRDILVGVIIIAAVASSSLWKRFR